MTIDIDIAQFVAAIGATDPAPNGGDHAKWRALFKQSNYFRFNGSLMIVKISRSKKPFWGVGKKFIDLLNSLENYYLVLLVSPLEGWVFTKREVNAHIESGRWNLRLADNNYKVNSPLPDKNSFSSPNRFSAMMKGDAS